MNFLFTGITKTEYEVLEKLISIKTKYFLRGEVIFQENDACNCIAYLNNGCITAKNIFSDGHETTVRIFAKGDTIGEALIFSSDNHYKATFISDTRTQISYICYDDLLKLINANPKISLNLLNKISNGLVSLNNRLKILSKKSVKAKLCEFLHLEYLKNSATTFTINYNKTELSSLLNVERPTLSKEISNMIDEGIIANRANTYTIINFQSLQNYL